MSLREWMLFHAPWNAIFCLLAWPHRMLERKRLKFIFKDHVHGFNVR